MEHGYFDVDWEKELIKEKAGHLIDQMLDHARRRHLDETWSLEQFKIVLDKEIKEWMK